RFLLFDFDDAVFLRDSFAPRGLHCAVRRRRFAAVVRAADLVVPGNEFLLQAAGARRARVIPTSVDTARYPLPEHQRPGAGVQLVWVGSSSTLRGLERIRPLLEHLGKQLPGVCLKLICDRFLDLAHLPVRPCVWRESDEPAALAAADIGISWLPDDD